MRNFTYSNNISQKEHDGFVSRHPNGNLLQSYNWKNIKSNWDSFTAGVYEDGILAASALVLVKSLPLGFTLFYLPRGPVMDFNDEELLTFFMKELKKEGKKRRALFIKMDPSLVASRYAPDKERIAPQADLAVFERAGLIHQGYVIEIKESIQPRVHMIIEQSPDYVQTLPKKTKKAMEQALKREVFIESGTFDLLDDFAAMIEKTENRKDISLRDKAYFERLLQNYPQSTIMLAKIRPAAIQQEKNRQKKELEEQMDALAPNQKKKRFSLQEKIDGINKDLQALEDIFGNDLPETQTIAGVLTIGYGKQAEMLYAGMDERFRRYMPQYLQYVKNIEWAFDQGFTRFSMGGVEGDLQDGLTTFKSHFNPMVYEYVGEFDLPTYRLLYPLARKLYEKKKGSL